MLRGARTPGLLWANNYSHFDERRPMCSLSTVSLVHSTFFSGFRFRSLMVRLRFSWKVRRMGLPIESPPTNLSPYLPGRGLGGGGLLSSLSQLSQDHGPKARGAEGWEKIK